jgi:hypothetical protein
LEEEEEEDKRNIEKGLPFLGDFDSFIALPLPAPLPPLPPFTPLLLCKAHELHKQPLFVNKSR